MSDAPGPGATGREPLLRWTLPFLRPYRGRVAIIAALLLALPRRPRTVVAALGGVLLGALTVLNVLDMEFTEYLGRDFDLVLDWGLLDDAQSYVADSMGRRWWRAST